MVSEEAKQSPPNPKSQQPKETNGVENGQNLDTIVFSPRFKSMAAMAGWDEEALLIATLIVEDTPDRDLKYRKRSHLYFKTPPTNSRRKRRTQRSPEAIPVSVLDLDQGETPREDTEKKNTETKALDEEKEVGEKRSDSVPSTSSTLPCMDKLREELSCAICLEICFEPSTTTCGHSFCRKCLRSAADKCGKKCPKCRQLISNGRSCTVNTVLWNTIQLLFPQEVEARMAAGALNSREAQSLSPENAFYHNLRNGNNTRASGNSSRASGNSSRASGNSSRASGNSSRASEDSSRASGDSSRASRIRSREVLTGPRQAQTSTSRRQTPSQDEDAALALRLQRQEFLDAFAGTQTNHLPSTRANLRAMASRAINLRIRSRHT